MNELSIFSQNAICAAEDDVFRSEGNIRLGQAVWNCVVRWDEETAKILHGTEFDPFYHDDRVEGFLAEVDRIRFERQVQADPRVMDAIKAYQDNPEDLIEEEL